MPSMLRTLTQVRRQQRTKATLTSVAQSESSAETPDLDLTETHGLNLTTT